MYSSYGVALNASHGIAANAIKYHRQAEELSAKLGRTEMTLEALDWQFGLHFNAGEILASKITSLKMKKIGSKLKHSIAIASGCQGLGMAAFMLGNFREAREEFELGLSTARNCISAVHCYPSMTLSSLAWTVFVLGREAGAKDYARSAVESARQESPHALAAALCICSYVYQCIGDTDKVYKLTEELVEHTKKYGEQMYLSRGTIIRAWADCVSHKSEEPIHQINSTINFLLNSKEEIETTFLLGLMAEMQIKFRRLIDAQTSLDRALEIADRNKERFYLPEIYRLKAILSQIDSHRFAPMHGEDYMGMARKTAEMQHAAAWLHRISGTNL
jgi:tetratricopeptide (TPR) repeat protein